MSPHRFLILALVAIALAGSAVRSEQAGAAEPQKLFALDAEQGALEPLQGKPSTYRLVLEQVRARAIYFTDRPAREVGTVAVRAMLRRLFAGDSPDPNAAINAVAARRGQLLMGVELLGWHYDAHDRKLALRVRHLPQGGRTISKVREDTVLPPSLRHTSVFIDDCCGVESPATVFNTGASALALSINNGPQTIVPAASTETLLPGSASIDYEPDQPGPGTLGPGLNYLTVLPVGAIAPITFPIDLPTSVQFRSLELYLFLGPSTIGWTVLDSGRLIASSAPVSAP